MEGDQYNELFLKIIGRDDIAVDFSEKEKAQLIEHYINKDLNQFAFIIVNKVVKNKAFEVPENELIPLLIEAIADYGIVHKPVSNQIIVGVAETFYKFIYLLDIKEIYKR